MNILPMKKRRTFAFTTVGVTFVGVLLCSGPDIVSAFAPSITLRRKHCLLTLLPSSVSDPSSRSSARTHEICHQLYAAPRRLDGNVDGPLHVNDKCINCAACAMFAPSSFRRNDREMAHNVYHQPTSDQEIDEARAALSACPVAAIRVETSAHRHHNDLPPMPQRDLQLTKELAISPKFNGRPVPFPRPLTVAKALTNGGGEDEDDDDDSSNGNDETNSRVWFVGHHNEASFGATPYIFYSQQDDKWIMVDTPRFSKSTVRAVDSLTKGRPVDYLILTHVDDTPGHNDWKDYYPNLQRVFHAGDTGRYNWVGDTTLEHVEVLLNANGKDEDYDCGGDGDGEPTLPAFDIHGNRLTTAEACQKQVVIYHTPGHSPGSISILFRNDQVNGGGVLFTGDTYAYRLSSGQMTGFPRYGNDRQKQAQILSALLDLDWTVIAPGHGHYRDYSMISNKDKRRKVQRSEMESAIKELQQYGVALRRPQ